MHMQLNSAQAEFTKYSHAFAEHGVLERIWAHDHTVWRQDPDEIANRLGWLDIAERLQPEIPRLRAFAGRLKAEGYSHVLLLGMGGSSLAPEVLRKTFGIGAVGLDLAVLDSTDPGAVLHFAETLDPARTLFLVSTKSGGTVETFSFFKYFYNWTVAALGEDLAGAHFAAVTDPGSGLVEIAKKYAFREVFLNDPDIGGRYSALSMFGLVPAALLGLDLDQLVGRAIAAASAAHSQDCDAVQLGLALGVLARNGRDKLTLLFSPEIESFGDWVEQLVAESTGKNGSGILPVVKEVPGHPARYGADRVFVYTSVAGDDPAQEDALVALEQAGHPIVRIPLADRYDLGGQFFAWEMATAIAGHVMDIQPFDQPNVETAKVLARKMTAAYLESGELPAAKQSLATREHLADFLEGISPGDYVCLQAYVTPNASTAAALQSLRLAIRERTRAAVTVGYGPRFLHSTGQLHKGDGGNGLFIQITSGAARDALIPDEAGQPGGKMSFQVLKLAQALGDYQALESAHPPRRVIHFHLEDSVPDRLRALI